jgi:hypothetical protein
MRIVDGVDHVGDSSVNDGLAARACAAGVVARFKRDHHRGAAKIQPGCCGLRDRVGLSVRGARTAVVSGNLLAARSINDDGAHQWVGSARAPQGFFERCVHGGGFGGAERRQLFDPGHVAATVMVASVPGSWEILASKSHRKGFMCVVVPSL